MAINFGAPPRQESQIVKSPQQMQEDFTAAEKNYQNEMARIQAAMAAIQSQEQYADTQTQQFVNSGALDSFFADQAAINPVWNDPAKQAAYKAEYVRDVAPTLAWGGNADAASKAYVASSPGLSSVASYNPESLFSGYQADATAASDAFAKQKADFEAFTANQERQKSAYAQQSGGGFAGGIIDASYSDPFSNQISGQRAGGLGGLGGMPTDPSLPNVAMPWQQPWGTPGFGQPGQGNSQGVGGYSPTGQQSTNQQGSQWGGVFGAKNPWSPA